jgi:hypothetical protein
MTVKPVRLPGIAVVCCTKECSAFARDPSASADELNPHQCCIARRAALAPGFSGVSGPNKQAICPGNPSVPSIPEINLKSISFIVKLLSAPRNSLVGRMQNYRVRISSFITFMS